MRTKNPDVVVVGAGIAGASIAAVLARGGLEVLLLERQCAYRDRQSQIIPSEDPDYGDLGRAFPAWTGPARGAILQPPEPEIPPSPQILERMMDYDADREAAD